MSSAAIRTGQFDEVLPLAPIRQWVLSVPFPLRFLFAREPAAMGGVLGIVIRAISSHLIQQAGLPRAKAQTGAVTLIQRFGGALNLNVHCHILFLDGVYDTNTRKRPHFVLVPAPTLTDLQTLIERISERVGRHLERGGLLVRDAENAYLAWDSEEASPLDDLAGHAITYRIAVGPNRGQKAFTLQTLPAREVDPAESHCVACAAGFSLHAGVAARAYQRDKLERLCRYVTRPAVAEPRLSITAGGHIRYSLKTPWRDGTTHVLFEPLDFRRSCASMRSRH